MLDDCVTVVRIEDDAIVVVPHNGGRGGPEVVLPPNPDFSGAVGDVLWLIEDSDGWDFDPLGNAQLGRKLKVGGKPLHWSAALADGTLLSVLPSDLGVTDERTAQRLLRVLRLWSVADGTCDHRFHAQDLEGALASLAAEDSLKAAEGQKKQESRRRQYRTDRFNNAYNFVPLPETVTRAPGQGHLSRSAGTVSGKIEVTLDARTPLLVRTETNGPVPDREGTWFVPGSSVHGAVRSLHEALCGGCLRVIDLDFVPGYRDLLSADNKLAAAGWQLAVVDEVDRSGTPTSLQLCDDVVWVGVDALKAAFGGAVKTGVRFNLAVEPQRNTKNKRNEIRDPEGVRRPDKGEDGSHVLLVTDTKARKKSSHVLFAAGRLTEKRLRMDDAKGKAAWRLYLASVDMSRDVGGRKDERSAPRETLQQLERDVEARLSNGRLIMVKRLAATPAMVKGYVLWAQVKDGHLHSLALAQTWRHPGQASVRKRIPPDAFPCEDAASLCPSCLVFGAAPSQDHERENGRAAQGYKGHVRMGDFTAINQTVVSEVRLAPMLSPRPGAGNFYLSHTREQSVDELAPAGTPSLREWGSRLDAQSNRRIRGRKHYWHTTPRKTGPRYLLQDHQGADNAGNTSNEAQLVPAGTRFRGCLTFENITPAQLGSLLAVLRPDLVLDIPVDRACWHVGGGRPLGLGSVSVTDLMLVLDADGGGRYRGQSPSGQESPDTYVRAFVEGVSPAAQRGWSALAAMLTLDHVNPDTVRYPTVVKWPENPQCSVDWSGEASLDWWKLVGGPTDQKHPRPPEDAGYVVLPDADSADPSLPINPGASK